MRRYVKLTAVAFLLMLMPVIAVAASNGLAKPVEAAPLAQPSSAAGAGGLFAKYDGIDGESTDANHDKWIDVLLLEWGSSKPDGGATGQSRRRGTVIVEDLTLTMAYEKSSVKLLEKLNMGEVIPKLEIEQTANFGGSRATYIKYELKNVQVTSWHVNAAAGDGPPTVTIANNFEEYKVTYTEYDSEGNKHGNVETTWKVEKGEK